jgi:hypothetical protein
MTHPLPQVEVTAAHRPTCPLEDALVKGQLMARKFPLGGQRFQMLWMS